MAKKKKAKAFKGLASRHKPVKFKPKAIGAEREDEGPLEWFLPQMEETYSRLAPKGAPPPAPVAAAAGMTAFASSHQPGVGESVFHRPSKDVWRDRLAKYKNRKASAVRAVRGAEAVFGPASAAIPGANNWRTLGPNIVMDGQTVGENPVAGRVVGVAFSPTGDVVYAATAAGGVFRSDDAGASWRSLMDGFDVDPTDFASASLACGAIAIDPDDVDRVYVGTGEGDTHSIFSNRIVNALPAYRGIGPIRSDDGGKTWLTETCATGSPDLAGDAFFALAVDPRDRENVVAATSLGLYQRVPGSGEEFEWTLRRGNVHSSVVVARSGGVTRFFAAEWGAGVVHSTDGKTWRKTGTSFPTAGVGRIALAVQPNRPDLLFAFVVNAKGAVQGIYRLEGVTKKWRKIANPPDVLPTDQGGSSQGSYDVCIAVDPLDENIVYLGGSYANVPPFPGSVWRCNIVKTGVNFRVGSSASIGTHAHADVHVLAHAAGDPDQLWCGTDGGLFINRDPRGSGQFASRNQGLSCLCSNFIAQHPTDTNILFSGLQDNGTVRTASSPSWTHVSGGDGGYCLINWNKPNEVLVFVNGSVRRSTTGGVDDNSWSSGWDFPWATMTQPIVSPPYNPGSPGSAEFVALGAGQSVFVSKDFLQTVSMSFDLPSTAGRVFALAYPTSKLLYIGTTIGRVFRAKRTGSSWTYDRLDDAAAGPLGLSGLITDVAVDLSDPSLDSIYVCFGGMGDARRVWRFDGNAWEVRSGQAGSTDLLDVEHNALAVDPGAPDNVYAGADIGVWHSPDKGQNWQPFQNGLPDAPVFDLQFHPTKRLLRAATHGRGLYEIKV